MRPIALALLLVWPCLGCGGSSSETPPPLEPDATSSRYLGPRLPKPEEASAPAATPEPDEDDLPAKPRKPAVSTWGSGKATPSAPAPSLTSPTEPPR